MSRHEDVAAMAAAIIAEGAVSRFPGDIGDEYAKRIAEAAYDALVARRDVVLDGNMAPPSDAFRDFKAKIHEALEPAGYVFSLPWKGEGRPDPTVEELVRAARSTAQGSLAHFHSFIRCLQALGIVGPFGQIVRDESPEEAVKRIERRAGAIPKAVALLKDLLPPALPEEHRRANAAQQITVDMHLPTIRKARGFIAEHDEP